MRVPEVSFAHIAALSEDGGMYEHAEFSSPRREHGFCVDDVARGLVVAAREPAPDPRVLALTRQFLGFTAEAIDDDGRCHNRRSGAGPWIDAATTGDHWGRALWGLGTAAAHAAELEVREHALAAARRGMTARSRHPRSMAYAAIGAYEVLQAVPGDPTALALLAAARGVVGRPSTRPGWPWPQSRLQYANAAIPEALLAVGAGLRDDAVVADGLLLLDWLVAVETRGSHLSVTPAGGWSLGEPRPGFDQQPIEVTALAEACYRAWVITGEARWSYVIDRCSAWFLGWNDTGRAMYDPATSGGLDGLLEDTVNLNQGAESTLAAIATFQRARAVALEPVR